MEEQDNQEEDGQEVLPQTGRIATLWNQLSSSEISGSLGDLGTFIPLYVALCRQGSLYASPALFFAGLGNVTTGWLWDLPMPVQPMKTIAAVALTEVLSREQVTAAGVWMGILLVILSFGLIDWVNKIVPLSVVSGMQIGVGTSLAIKGFHMISELTWAGAVDCILLALVCAVMSLIFLRDPLVEAGLSLETNRGPQHGGRRSEGEQHKPAVGIYLFLLGAIIAVAQLVTEDMDISWRSDKLVAVWALKGTSWEDWKTGLLEGALPQLPLTTLNSVISVCCLAHSLYPERRRDDDTVIPRRQVCLSVGLINLLLCPFGAMPNCHGAGGLAGQHKFGARHGASVIFLGLNKMILATVMGGVLLPFLEAIPSSVLGVMLAIAGHELACTGFLVLTNNSTPASLRINAAVSLLTAAVILGMKKTHYGAISGWVMHVIYTHKFRWRRRNEDAAEYAIVTQTRDNDSLVAPEAGEATAARNGTETC